MKKTYLIAIASFLALNGYMVKTCRSQNIAINATGAAANASAMLDVNATNRGLLIPRMTYAQRTTPGTALVDGSGNLPAAAQALIVYQTNTSGGFPEGFYYNTSTTVTPSWKYLFGGTGSSVRWNEIIDPNGNLSLTHGTNTTTFNFANTTSTAFTLSANSITSGTGLSLTSTATGFTGTLGNISLSGSNAANTGTVFKVSNSGALNTGTAAMVTNLGTGESFRVNDQTGDADATPFVVDQAGDVGIGTPTPAYKLDVSGEITSRGSNSYRMRQATYSVIHRNDNANYYMLLTAAADPDGTWNALRPFRLNLVSGDLSMGNNVLYVEHNGNVGIGTITPGALLHANLSTQATATINSLLISRWTRPTTGGVKWGNAFDILLGSYGTAVSSQSRVDFMLANGATATPDVTVMTLQGNGNVGIGTTTPGAALTIGADKVMIASSGDANTEADILFDAVGVVSAEVNLVLTSDGDNNGAADIIFKTSTQTQSGGTNLMIIKGADGNVGIGTSNPAALLHVVNPNPVAIASATFSYFDAPSTAITNGPATPTVSIRASNAIWAAGGFYASSDRRVKKNIISRNSADALALINKLNPVKYNWIDQSRSIHSFEDGFIAQEVEEVLPEIVNTNTEVIPTIMELIEKTTYANNQLSFHLARPEGLKQGDHLKIITTEGKEYTWPVASVSNHEITLTVTDTVDSLSRIFVYGKEVSDFKTVEYDRIFTVGISAIQELSHLNDLQQKAIESLKRENSSLKATIETYNSRLLILEEIIGAKTEK